MNDRPIVREQNGRVAVLQMVHGRVNALDVRLCLSGHGKPFTENAHGEPCPYA